MRALLVLGLLALVATTGCSANNFNGAGMSRAPSLGVKNGIWRFPTPHAVPAASSERSGSGAGGTSGSSSAEPGTPKPPRPQRLPRPYAANTPHVSRL